MKCLKPALLATLLCLAFIPQFAQTKSKSAKSDKKDEKTDDAKKEDDPKSIEDVVKKAKKYTGLFTVYQDTTNGKVFMEVKKDQLNKEFIHFSQVTDAPATDAWS